MIEILGLLAGVLLPWAAGFAIVRLCLTLAGERDPWAELGYGHFAGILVVTLLIRAQDLAGMRLAFAPLAVALAVLTAVGLVLAHKAGRGMGRSTTPAWPRDGFVLRCLAAVGLALIALRVGTFAVEVLLRPLFPWDSWTQWATKARVWSALREVAPFVDYDDWMAGRPGYTDAAPHYPGTIPLLQTWMALSIGRWDDTLINVPWLGGFVALGFAAYGQLRRLGVGSSWATIATWLVLSLPLLGTHVALAGYADFHVAAGYALAVLALAQWESDRSRGALALFAAAALLLPLLKVPGVAWLGTLALGLAVATWGRTAGRTVAIIVAMIALAVVAAMFVGSAKVSTPAAATQYRIAESLLLHLFAFASFHTLWYLLPLVLAVAWREVLSLRGTSLALAAGFVFLLWSFFFTRAGDWVVDYTTVNRALLHIAPAATAFASLLVWRAARRHGARPSLARSA